MSKVDAEIRRIKELFAVLKKQIAMKVTKMMVKDLVTYAVARFNIQRTTVLNQNVCPKALFTDMKGNYTMELNLALGIIAKSMMGLIIIWQARVSFVLLCPLAYHRFLGISEFVDKAKSSKIQGNIPLVVNEPVKSQQILLKS